MDIPTTIAAFIIWLGSPAALSFALSTFIEKQTWFQAWDADRKARFAMLLAVLLSVVSFALNRWTPAAIIVGLDPLFAVMVQAALTFYAMDKYHSKAHNVTSVTSEARAVTAAIRKAAVADHSPKLSGAPEPSVG